MSTITQNAAKAGLIQVDRALESFRDAGYDLPAAVGEVIDNSLEAKAQHINIQMFEEETAERRKGKQRASIKEIAFADDGIGITPDVLPSTLTLGYSSRYNQRTGMGRFGVGAKLAALSQGKRVDLYTRPIGSEQVYHTYFDLEEIKNGEQEYLQAELVRGFPEEYAHLMRNGGGEFESGTLVIWSKVDRLEEGGRFGSSVGEREAALIRYLARTFRTFLHAGREITLNGRRIELFDPLFLLKNPRAEELLGENWQAEVIDSTERSPEKIVIDGHEVRVTVTLLPESVRRKRGEGGNRGSAGKFQTWHIEDNQGRVSILRQGREIYYDIVPRLFPKGVIKDQDRFIGVEISFPAALDEYFQVRHVKRGAEPVDKLRADLRNWLERPINSARDKITKTWGQTETKEQATGQTHTTALEALKATEESAPPGIGGLDLPPEQAKLLLDEVAEGLAASRGIKPDELPPEQMAQELEKLKAEIQHEPVTIIDDGWPGGELFELTHLNGRVIVRLNWRHPFMRDIYSRVKDLAAGETAALDADELQALGRRVQSAIDLLLFSYARAENAHRHPDQQYGSLRRNWGHFLIEGVEQLLNDHPF